MTSRERVYRTLEFRSPDRAPREMWVLPWSGDRYADEVQRILSDYPQDTLHGLNPHYEVQPIAKGNPYDAGEYMDEWGCRFVNIQRGIIGEVKEPLVAIEDEDWDDLSHIHLPRELLTFDSAKVDAQCMATDSFTISGSWVHPFEQLQYIRTSAQLYMDLVTQPPKMLDFMMQMHRFYCELLEKWAKTKVDALYIMDDWGAQRGLLVNPALWRELFKPLYRDYVEIAHRHGKKLFMHSCGNILSIVPDLVELGVDALNAQVHCMGIENLRPFKGGITFWGEVDRQEILPHGTSEDVDREVQLLHDTLWENGGCFAQCEFGLLAKPANVRQVYTSWDRITSL